MLLEAELVMELFVELGETVDVGNTPEGYLRLIPITGGSFWGEGIKGKILGGGYDWNTTLDNGLVNVFAKYALMTDDGVAISVENRGHLDSGCDSLIKTSPSFQVKDGKYEWLRRGIYVGCLEVPQAEKPAVCLKMYKMK